MTGLSQADILRLFEENKQSVSQSHSETMKILPVLFSAVQDLRDAGLDVDLSLSGWSGSHTFQGFTTGGTSTFSGKIRLGPQQEHTISISSVTGSTPKVYLGYYNLMQGQPDGRWWIYDFLADETSVATFQKQIIELTARNAVLADHTPAGMKQQVVNTKRAPQV